jgi:hypothetical protein
VYLGRIVMELPASGAPVFHIDATDRVYVGLNAEIVDHPGNPARVELGGRPTEVDTRTIGKEEVKYAAGSDRDFAVFVARREDDPGGPTDALEPTIAVSAEGTQIRDTVTVHGNLVLDGAALVFPDNSSPTTPDTGGQPALYRAADDELRIDLGSLNGGKRRLVLGVTKDGEFVPALEIGYPVGTTPASVVVTIRGDLRIDGTISSPDVRIRTVTEEVAALLTGMVQAGIAAGSP